MSAPVPRPLLFLNRLAVISALLGASMIGLMAVIVSFEVVARAVGRPTSWAHEITVYLLIWSAFLSYSLAQFRGDHFRVTLIVDMLPASRRDLLELFGTLVASAFCVLMLWRGLEMVVMDYRMGRVTPTLLHVPMVIIRMAIPVGALLLLLQLLGRIVLLWAAIRKAGR
jgi:TRAP-type C4-dicarboxylate transport system permease small subunit